MTVWKAVQCSTGSRWLQEMARYLESKFAVVVENLAPVTRASDVRYECDAEGSSRREIPKTSQQRAADARAAWNKMDGLRMDGRRWKVNYADELDFKHFDWKWFEQVHQRCGFYSVRSPPLSRTRSRSYSRSPTRQ